MNRVFGALLLTMVLFISSGPAQAGWFSSKEKPKETKPAPAVKKAAPVSDAKPQPKLQAAQARPAVQTRKASAGNFFDLEPDSASLSSKARKQKTAKKSIEPVRASSEETEKMKQEMLKLNRDIGAARAVRELPKFSGASAAPRPPVIPRKTAYQRPPMVKTTETNPSLPPLESARKK